jgi:hypothetical protein
MGLRGRFVFRDAARARKLCAGTTPLHRLYNNGQGGAPNHRYTTCTNLRDRMVANEGWVSEGVAMCVAGDSFDCKADTSIGLPPGPPIGLTVTPGNANVTLTFKPPTTDGGLPITSYTASCSSPGSVKTATNPASPITVRGLVNGVSNVCSVVATNEAGNGPAAPIFATPGAFNNGPYNNLAIPPLLMPTMVDGTLTYDLTLAPSSRQYVATGPATVTFSYNNAGFWGPTLVMNKGDTVRNAGAQCLAGRHHHPLARSAAAGCRRRRTHAVIAAGSTWTTQPFVVRNNASTYWYHPHRHATTQKQLTLGAGGFIIVRDAEERRFHCRERTGSTTFRSR